MFLYKERPSRISTISWIVWLSCSVLTLAWIGWTSGAWITIANQLDAGFKDSSGKEVPQGGIYLENDTPYWLGYADRIAAGENWRIRETNVDNAPYGREVHWSQSISWLMVAFGELRRWVTGEEIRQSIERAAVFINPVLWTAMVFGLGIPLFRSIGAIPAGLFQIYIIILGNIEWAFNPLRPDHQGLHCLFGAFTLGGLVLGGAGWVNSSLDSRPKSAVLVRPLEVPTDRVAQFWFIFSGVNAGLGLWVSAAVQGMLMLMVFCAGVFLAIFAPGLEKNGNIRVKPELWRWWGWACGGTSFLFYLIEYFPSHMGLRLEVNHPAYSVVSVAMGEAVCQFLKARYEPSKLKAIIFGTFAVGIVAILPVAIFFGPPSWHSMRDVEMFRMHKFIEEFLSFPEKVGAGYPLKFMKDFGVLPLFLLLALVVALSRRLRLYEWGIIWLAFALTYGTLALGYLQIRWLGVYGVMNIFMAAVVGASAWKLYFGEHESGRRMMIAAGVLLVLLFQPIYQAKRFIAYAMPALKGDTVTEDFYFPLFAKHFALKFKELYGPGAVVMASPGLAPALQYFADAKVVSSLYWENVAGLHAAVDFFADPGDERALRICRERGVTHVAMLQETGLMEGFYFMAHGKIDSMGISNALMSRLLRSEYGRPAWLKSSANTQELDSQIIFYRGKAFEIKCRTLEVAPGT